jgi:hypothetical protein
MPQALRGESRAAVTAEPAPVACEVSTAPALLLPLPKSGLPDFGINIAQVGQARPAWEKVGIRES